MTSNLTAVKEATKDDATAQKWAMDDYIDDWYKVIIDTFDKDSKARTDFATNYKIVEDITGKIGVTKNPFGTAIGFYYKKIEDDAT